MDADDRARLRQTRLFLNQNRDRLNSLKETTSNKTISQHIKQAVTRLEEAEENLNIALRVAESKIKKSR